MVVITPGRRYALSLILVACLCLVVYSNTLKNSFVLDDYRLSSLSFPFFFNANCFTFDDVNKTDKTGHFR